jgi:hypothetical protein
MAWILVRVLSLAVALCCAFGALPAQAADNLKLAPGLSFGDDSSSAFPIEGDDLGSARVEAGKGAIAFFGAAHCWNTNREAERVVALYPKFRDRVRFVVVDVEHPSEAQRDLVARHYRGSIPTVVVWDRSGRVIHAAAGETAATRGDTRSLEALLVAAAAP